MLDHSYISGNCAICWIEIYPKDSVFSFWTGAWCLVACSRHSDGGDGTKLTSERASSPIMVNKANPLHSHFLSCGALEWLLTTPPNRELAGKLAHRDNEWEKQWEGGVCCENQETPFLLPHFFFSALCLYTTLHAWVKCLTFFMPF